MRQSLNQDWMKRIVESPRLMLEIIKTLREVHENELCVIKRMEAGRESWLHRGRIDAIAFEVDTVVFLRGVGLYGASAKDNTKFKVHIKVFLKDECLLDETKEYTSNGSASPVAIMFSSSVKIKPNTRYDITTSIISGGPTLYGTNAKKVVQSSGTYLFDVTFFTSPLDQNGGTDVMGQIPALYFRAPFIC